MNDCKFSRGVSKFDFYLMCAACVGMSLQYVLSKQLVYPNVRLGGGDAQSLFPFIKHLFKM